MQAFSGINKFREQAVDEFSGALKQCRVEIEYLTWLMQDLCFFFFFPNVYLPLKITHVLVKFY